VIDLDLSEKLFALTTSVTFRIAFGKSFRGSDLDNGRFQEVVLDAKAVWWSFNASDYFPYVGWIIGRLSNRSQRLEGVFHELDHFFQQVIDLHLNPKWTKQDQHKDIIDLLLKIEREQNEFGATVRFIKNNIKAILLVISY
jgi:hypothetical protein